MSAPDDAIIEKIENSQVPTRHICAADTSILSGSMSLTDWRGGMTLFDGFYNTLPVDDFQDIDWENFSTKLAADQPDLPVDKSRATYFVPSLLRDAPLIGETKANAARLGLPLVGKQRSSDHVIEASVLVSELDGVDEEELVRTEKVLCDEKITYLIYSTYSHGKLGKTGVRARIVVPIDRSLDSKRYAFAATGLNRLVLGGNADPSGFKLCQQQGVWTTTSDRLSLAFKLQHQAGVASASALIAAAPTTPKKSTLSLSNLPVVFERNRVREALTWLSSENYDDWIQVGLWLKAAYGDAAFPIWLEWSEMASNPARELNDSDTYTPDKKWSNIDPRIPAEAGAGSLFGKAKLRALDAARKGFTTGHWSGGAKRALIYLRIYHPRTFNHLLGG